MKVEANEFRLGNYLSYEGKCVRIREIDERKIGFTPDPCKHFVTSVSYDLIKPIPLSEEILLKCGFSKLREGVFLTNHFGYTLRIDDQSDWCLCHSIDSPMLIGYIKYAHQLQNWWYLLTGKELKINL